MDVIDCGPGEDRAVLRPGDVATNCEAVRVLDGTNPPNPPGSIQKGTKGDDTLPGTEGRDILLGLAGNDTLTGLGGPDWLFGGSGNDAIDGGAGNDRAWAGSGNDTVSGGDDNDWLHAGPGVDSLNGGAGDDKLFAAANDGQTDTLDCGDGTDRAVIRSGDSAVNCEHVRSVPAN
jgi:Ca2+-binding RTX toxin-like protein